MTHHQKPPPQISHYGIDTQDIDTITGKHLTIGNASAHRIAQSQQLLTYLSCEKLPHINGLYLRTQIGYRTTASTTNPQQTTATFQRILPDTNIYEPPDHLLMPRKTEPNSTTYTFEPTEPKDKQTQRDDPIAEIIVGPNHTRTSGPQPTITLYGQHARNAAKHQNQLVWLIFTSHNQGYLDGLYELSELTHGPDSLEQDLIRATAINTKTQPTTKEQTQCPTTSNPTHPLTTTTPESAN